LNLSLPLEIHPARFGGSHISGGGVCAALSAPRVIVVVSSTVATATASLDRAYACDDETAAGVLRSVSRDAGDEAPKERDVEKVVGIGREDGREDGIDAGRAVGIDDGIEADIEAGIDAAADDVGAVEDGAGTGVEPMKPSPLDWNTLTELTSQKAFTKSAGLFDT